MPRPVIVGLIRAVCVLFLTFSPPCTSIEAAQASEGGGLSPEMLEFLAWAAGQEIDTGGRLEAHNTSDKGVGLFATRSFSAGDTLMSVPYGMLMSPDTAQRAPIAQMFRKQGIPDCETGDLDDCNTLLVMHLIQTYRNTSSSLAPWMRILPRTLGSTVVWSEEELEQIEGSNLHGISLGWQDHIKSIHTEVVSKLLKKYPKSLPKAHYSLQEFTWAFMTVFARAFDVSVDEGGVKKPKRVMGPVVDLFNHANVKSSYTFRESSRTFEVFTKEPIAAGDEAFLNYDPKNNADYLLQYGFVMQDNPNDYVGVMASIGPDAQNYKQKVELLSLLGHQMDQRHKLAMDGLPDKSIVNLRALCAADADIKSGKARLAMTSGKLISKANEQCVYSTLVSAIEGMLAKYPTSYVEDQAIIGKRGHSQDVKNALLLRSAEKKILIYNLSRYKRKLQALNDEL